jgi:hypothetical protein
VGLLTACSSAQVIKDSVDSPQDQKEIKSADQLLLAGKFQPALDAYNAYIEKRTFTVFYLQALLGRASALRNLDRCKESLADSRAVLASSAQKFKSLAAQALVESSLCYEMLGNDVKQLAALEDAYRWREHLSKEVAQAELPARLAAAHAKLDQTEESKKFLDEAMRGAVLVENQSTTEETKRFLSKLYFDMGSVSLSRLSIENMKQHLEAIKVTQVFLLKSVELEIAPWSVASAERLQANFQTFWDQIKNLPQSRVLDPEAAERIKKDQQELLVGLLLSAIEQLRNHRMQKSEVKTSNVAEKAFAGIQKIESEGLKFLNELGSYSNLTKEAQRFHQLKREGMIKDTTPEAAGPLEADSLKKDPNL